MLLFVMQIDSGLDICLKAAFSKNIHSPETTKIRRGRRFMHEVEIDVECVDAAQDGDVTSCSTEDDRDLRVI